MEDGVLFPMGSDTVELGAIRLAWLFGRAVKTGYRAHRTYYTRLVCNAGQ